MSEKTRGKYVDLRINGRLFPTWVMANFKKYKIPETLRGTDPCNEQVVSEIGTIKKNLRVYQQFVAQFLDYKSPYRDILLYHGLGSGKTASAINIYNSLYSYTPGWNVFILIKASLRGGWDADITNWLSSEDNAQRKANIQFVNYDAPNAGDKFMEAIKSADSSKKSMYIIEEVHNFIRNVLGNVRGEGGRAQVIYDYIIQDKLDNQDTRVVLLSGTPAVNDPFELSLLFNLLRPGIFPRSESEFNQLFITTTTHSTMNTQNKNLFQRRILGLVSYYLGATPDVYATKKIHYVNVMMSDYQRDVYNYFEDVEDKIELKARLAGKSSTTYKTYTRQASNFVFPHLSQNVTGELRPRPSKFKLTAREAEKFAEGDLKLDKASDMLVNINEYQRVLKQFIDGLDAKFAELTTQDKQTGRTIFDDLGAFMTAESFDLFHAQPTKSKVYKLMHECSAKFTQSIFIAMKSPGPVLVYSNYVVMEGLEVYKIYLKYFGLYSYMTKKELEADKIGYVEFHGGFEIKDRYAGQEAYNKKENMYGSLIKFILISPAGSEGLNLMNTRQVHILEPYWNEVRVTQMIGRAIRQCSHKDLPMADRHVDVYRFKSVRQSARETTDQHIEDLARSKDALIQSFLDALKEAAVDCALFKNDNMLEQEYKCFQFEERSLFNNVVGPAYKKDIQEDLLIDNGLNSTRAMAVKLKVIKIQAVKQLTPPGTAVKYSDPELYWYHPKSGVVYDYELHYPIGVVYNDDIGVPMKLDKDVYIIGAVIPIPMIS